MNTRLQVEHPVTEEIFGVDLVALQFRIAQGYSFPCETLKSKGHSVEARIYLEDPKKNFLPTPGYVASFVPYQQRGIRWEVGLDKAGEVSSSFDPMVAKLIATADTREKSLKLLQKALQQTFLATNATNIAFISEILDDPRFTENAVSTDYLKHNLPSLVDKLEEKERQFLPSVEKLVNHYLERESSSLQNSVRSKKSDFHSLAQLAFLKKRSKK